MAPRAEVLCNGIIGGEEALGVPWRLEALHAPFPLARGLVGILRAVIQVRVLPVFDTGQATALGSPVAFRLIGDDDPWNIPGIL